jgi:uncharacterized SAM-binding protein YcdF (DUF218 family)/glycosyltransferase involved in cell wall biosynthesis
MLSRHDIVCFSSIDWDFIWQGHQEIMAALAAQGNRVLFVENTGVRSPRLRDISRVTHRLVNWWRSTNGFHQERENLFVYSPLILPFPYARVARWINRAVLRRALARWVEATGFHRPIVWTFLPTPLVRDLTRALHPKLTIYYCIDDLASSSRSARQIRRSEAQVFREANLVFVTSQKLLERAARFTDRVHLFPFGVNYRQFERARNGAVEIPEDLQRLPRPVVGYVGGVHQWIDQELLAVVSARIPEGSLCLVGPTQTDVSRLARCSNVHLLGPRAHADVPRYIKGFDVAIIPYRLTEYTANVYPTKLNEYLAMGVPVVTTDLPEIRRFNAEYGGVVAVSPDTDGFLTAIRAAIEEISTADVERRIEVGRLNSWEARIARMSAIIEEELMARRESGTRWEESVRRLFRTGRRRIIRTAGIALAAYLLLFQTPFVWMVAEPLRVTEPSQPADAIVVFAGGAGESGRAGAGYQERVKQAVDLYRAGQASHLIFLSGYAWSFPEAEVMRELAVSHGVPASAIILETKAGNTYEYVVFVHRILSREGWRQVLLVSSPYHMRRALLTWRKVAPEVRVIAAPVLESQFYAHLRGASLEQIQGILHEYFGIVVYWWKGWV